MALELASPAGSGTPEVRFGYPELRVMDAANLIVSGGVVADMITADTMRALNGRFSSLAAANVAIGNAEIDTLQLAGNAVTVPVAAVGATFNGLGGLRQVLSLTLNLPAGTPAIILWAFEQEFGNSTDSAWDFSLRRGSTVLNERSNMRARTDWPSGIYFDNFVAGGVRTYSMWWNAVNSSITARPSMVVLGVKR